MIACHAYSWNSPTNRPGWTSYAPHHWIQRADKMGLGHLMAIVPYAPLICRFRGKLGCIAAGPHALIICYAMESNVIGMPLTMYRRITANDYPGPNQDRQRATEELRVFHIPKDFTIPFSSHEKRTIKIIAAFISEHWAWVINDFSSLVITCVFSRDRYWTPEELSPGTEVCKSP